MSQANREKVIVSIDIEAIGSDPCTSSCVMIGAVAVKAGIDPDPESRDWVVDQREWCLEAVPGRGPEQRCWDEFWSKNMPVWEHIQANALPPSVAMKQFADWYRELNRQYDVTFMAKPASYDWQWINCLYHEFGPADKLKLPFSINCLSTIIRVLGMIGVSGSFVSNLCRHPSLKHTHYAVDDALGQAYAYLKLTHWIRHHVTVREAVSQALA